jgi:cell wall-associated NlpC family hydrolase
LSSITKEKMTKLRNSVISLGLVLASSVTFLQPATADVEASVEKPASEIQAPITAPISKLSFEKPAVTSTPAPKVEAPVVAVQYTQPEAATTETKAAVPVAKTPQPVAPSPAKPAQAAVPTQAPVAASGRGAGLLASAYAQIGITQDCTAMVERALGSIGIITGDLAPGQFYQFGSVVSDPQPGDIMISAGHVAIYAGNGMAISGGFNGNQTVLHPARYIQGVTYVRV